MVDGIALVLAIILKWNIMHKLVAVFLLLICGFLNAQEPPLNEVDTTFRGDTDSKRLLFEERLFAAFTARATENPNKQIAKLREALEVYDDESIVHYELSKVLAEEGELEEALHHAYRAADLEQDNVWILRHFSTLLRMNEMWEDRIVVLEELLRLEPNELKYELEISESLAALGEYRKAIKALNAIEKEYGIIPDLAERKKNIWLAANKPRRAERELKRLVKAYPEIPEFWGVLANFYLANNKESKAIDAFHTLLEHSPKDPRAHFNLAELYRNNHESTKFMHHLKQGMRSPDVEENIRLEVIISTINASFDAPELKDNLEDMLKYAEKFHPNSAIIHTLRGDYFMAINDIDRSLNAYQRALQLEGGQRKEVYMQLLRIHLERSEYDDVVQYGMDALEQYPNQNELHLITGIGLMETKKDSAAAAVLQKGLDITFGNLELKSEFQRLLAEAHHRAENHRESDRFFDQYLQANPKDALTLNNYAYYLAVREDHLDRALEMTITSNELSVNNPTYLDTWAWVLYKKGEYKNARNILERAIDLMDGVEDSEVFDHYGDILHALGENSKAIEYWKRAIDLGGNEDEIQPKIDNK